MEKLSACTSQMAAGGQQTGKRKFFQWAVKWFYANMAEDTLERPDAAALICLLQSIGFQLREFERVEDSNENNKLRPDNETVRVSIECGTSGMRASLELNDVKCKCPDSEDTKSGSLWSVSGTAPTPTKKIETTKKFEETGSNLLPQMSKETNKILHDVTYHLLNVIAEKSSDINQNDNRSNLNLSSCKENTVEKNSHEVKNSPSANFLRSYTQPEILLPNSTKRKQNWAARKSGTISGLNDHDGSKYGADLEKELIDNDQPRPSPPKIASSPVFMNQLSGSLSQLSLQSEEGNITATEHVMRARKNLDMALELMMAKKSPTSQNSSILEQGTFLKPLPGGLNVTGGGSRRQSTSSNGSLCSPGGVSRPRTMSTSILSREPSFGGVKSPSAPKSSILTRRSVGAALSTSTIAPPSSIRRQSSNLEPTGTTSKIPARRKSFGVVGSQPLKLAATSARNAALAAKKSSIDSTKVTNQPSTQKTTPAINQPPGTLKFGYTKKKSSLV